MCECSPSPSRLFIRSIYSQEGGYTTDLKEDTMCIQIVIKLYTYGLSLAVHALFQKCRFCMILVVVGFFLLLKCGVCRAWMILNWKDYDYNWILNLEAFLIYNWWVNGGRRGRVCILTQNNTKKHLFSLHRGFSA